MTAMRWYCPVGWSSVRASGGGVQPEHLRRREDFAVSGAWNTRIDGVTIVT